MRQECKEKFSGYLSSYQKAEAVAYATELIRQGTVTIPQLYEEIITPALNAIMVDEENEDEMVWQEHLMTNIARTVVENCYPLVLSQGAKGQEQGPTVVILCPEEEYHDIGPRMAADLFTLEGYRVHYVGANTPLENVLSICRVLAPDVLAFSVSNFYHISLLKDIVASVKQLPHPPYVIASGSALLRTSLKADALGCDEIVQSHGQIQKLKESLKK